MTTVAKNTEIIENSSAPKQSVIGWQGVRFTLPPDWNLTGFSMDRETGYLRVDAPGNSAMTVQVRWTKANLPETKTLSHFIAPKVAPKLRKLLKRPEPIPPKPDLKASLEKNAQRFAEGGEKREIEVREQPQVRKNRGRTRRAYRDQFHMGRGGTRTGQNLALRGVRSARGRAGRRTE